MRSSEPSSRILPLEALRGLAAIGVLFHHFVLAFLPHLLNLSPTMTEDSVWIGSPLFLLVNGKAMVVIFFILSGYVLTLKGMSFQTKSELAFESSKRWFRLTPAVSLSLLISYLLFAFHSYRYDNVYALNGALMFQHYGGYAQTEQPAFSAFLYQALLGNTVLGEFDLNPVLWTMMPEFYGSIMVFVLAFIMMHVGRNVFLVALLLLFILLVREGIWFVPFCLALFAHRLT